MCEPMPTTYRVERMKRQTKKLKEYIKTLERTSPDFPFHRLTEGQSPDNVDVPLRMGASAVQPYIGVFSVNRITQTFVTGYPGVVMTIGEYNGMPFVVPTAVDTKLKRRMTVDDQRMYGDIVILGFPTAPGVNVMSTVSTKRRPNVLLHGSGKRKPAMKEGKLTVPSDFVSIHRIVVYDDGQPIDPIPKNKELFVAPYSVDFLEDMPKHCDYCFMKDDYDNELEEGEEGNLFRCTVHGCNLRFHARCQMGRNVRARNFMCPDHHAILQAEADRDEREERAAAASPRAAAAASSSSVPASSPRDAMRQFRREQSARRLLQRPSQRAMDVAANSIAVSVHNWNVTHRKRWALMGGAIVIWVYISSQSWIDAFGGDTPLHAVEQLFEDVHRSGEAPSMSLVHISASPTGYMAAFSTNPHDQVDNVPDEPARGAANTYNLITWTA